MATRETLRHSLPQFLDDKIEPLIGRRLDDAAHGIAERVATSVFDCQLAPLLRDFRNGGRSVTSLKNDLARVAEHSERDIRTMIDAEIERTQSAIATDTTELMVAWFREHQLVISDSLTPTEVNRHMGGRVQIEVPNVYQDIEAITTALSTTIGATLVAMLSGGTGIKLISSGPLGLAIGAIVGAVTTYLVTRYGLAEARKRAEDWSVPGWILQRALPDRRLDELRGSIEQQVMNRVASLARDTRDGLRDKIQRRVTLEIANLSAISQCF